MLSVDQKVFEDTLLRLKLVSKEQLDKVKIESVRSGTDLDEVIQKMQLLSEEDIVKASAISSGVAYVDLTNVRVAENILKLIPKEMTKKYQAIPFGISGNSLNVAMVNPNNVQAIEFIERRTNLRANVYMASEKSISRVLNQYQDMGSEINEALKSMKDEQKAQVKEEAGLDELVQDAPVTRAVNTILEYAAKAHASDIHVEPWENNLKVRFRIDGVLQETMALPPHIESALVSRIKILSNLKIDEHRIPQDGRFNINVEGQEIDIRVAVSPTVHGEKIVMRLLNKSEGVISLEKLGVRGRSFELIERGIKQPHGMVLSTGPTGSGKTTTLYAILMKMNTPQVNIVTLEDPVEYQVPGVNQIQVNAAVGLTFASGLRSILRQDPNIIMVGEIRDAETADLAVQSALTGHTVLSTIHTNSASGVLPRLLDMKIEPFLIASTVNTVIGQRLVRLLCPKCKKIYKAGPALTVAIQKTIGHLLPTNEEEVKKLGYEHMPLKGSTSFQLYSATGCDQCNNTGYAGRIGIYEVYGMTPSLERLIVSHATTFQIQEQALKEGMITMRQDGFFKALEGLTTIEEVIAKASEV